MAHWMRLLLACLLGLLWPWMACAADKIAVVLDVNGPVTVVSELNGFTDESPLLRTNHLSAGNRLLIGEGAEVTLMHLELFKRFTLRGPEEAVVQREGFQLRSGMAEPVAAATYGNLGMLASLGKGRSQLKMPEVVIGIRDLDKKIGDIILAAPVDKERVGEPRLEFAWHPLADTTDYRLMLRDADGGMVLDVPVQGSPFVLPESVVLQPGGRYTWQVVAANGARTEKSAVWSFEVLTSEEQESLQLWRPGADATISDRVLYAMLLEKLGVIRMAGQQWRILHEQQPADPLFAKKARLGGVR
ncbi:MAG: hypothetical protein H7837_04820 [Magnetococcus sp. MYC-9]